MDVDIRDSASLKPAELDELSQVLRKAGSPLPETAIDDQVERFSRVTMVVADDIPEISATLSRLYGTDVDVLRVRGRVVVVGTPDDQHVHHVGNGH